MGVGIRMNQNFNFMEKLVPKILDKVKILTNRTATPFRAKCNVGDIMHCFTGLRTKNCQKIGDAKVIKRAKWNFESVPLYNYYTNSRVSPIKEITWGYFAKLDGFDTWQDFVDYFFFHKQRDLGFYCYLFEIIEV